MGMALGALSCPFHGQSSGTQPWGGALRVECLPSQSRWRRCHLRARPGCGAREAFGLLELAWSQRKAELNQSGAEAWEWSVQGLSGEAEGAPPIASPSSEFGPGSRPQRG